MGRVARIQGYVDSVEHHPSGGLAALTYANGRGGTIGYDSRQRVASISAPGVVGLDYDYDAVGNVRRIDDRLNAARNRRMTYDALDRLTAASGFWGEISFTYDALGNRTAKTVAGARTTYAYGSNRLLSASGAEADSFSYDQNGNMTSIRGHSLAYDSDNRLVGVDGSVTYAYDGDGQRIKRIEGGDERSVTLYHYDAFGNLLAETDQEGEPKAEYVYLGDRLIARVLPEPEAPPEPSLPNPEVTVQGPERYEAGGAAYLRYRLPVTNWQAYPAELFAPAPDLPPCGTLTNASRAWVYVSDARNDRQLQRWCTAKSPQDFGQGVSISVREDATQPPERVYVEIVDRRTGATYRSAPVSPPPLQPPLALPKPEVTVQEPERYEVRGNVFWRYRLPVTNWQDYPAELFAPAPDLPPCGANANASRTWVQIHDAESGRRLYGFCAFRSPQNLESVWFSVRDGDDPPEQVYVELEDRRAGATYRSNPVQLPPVS